MSCAHASEPPSASAILQELRAFRECGSVLYVAAHPDDENTQFLAYLSRGRGVRTAYLSLTRGEGGQNLIGPEIGDPLGVIRTQELLAARRVDGAQQFFTRARDFGFSKDFEQTLAKWDRKDVLSDVVRVIRQFQPDVIVTRFAPEGGGTHGHHTASTVLALEAFKQAGDPQAFPEQGLAPWQPKRILWNSFRGAGEAKALRLDIGGYLPLLGESLGEISARSRSNHRSQGYGSVGSRGSRPDDLLPLDGQPARKDIFDGIDTTWGRYPGGEDTGRLIDEAIAKFNPLEPAASVPALLAIHRRVADLPPKVEQLDRIIQDCLGLYVETTCATAEATPGETLHLRQTAILRANYPVEWLDAAVPLHVNQPVTRETDATLPADTPLTEPYWLREEGAPGMYRVDDPGLIGRPENPPVLPVVQRFRVGEETINVADSPVQITADPAKGEVRRRLDVVPPVVLNVAREVELFTPGAEHVVEVEVRTARANQNGAVSLDAPAGWQVAPASQEFRLAAVGERARFAFKVTAPAQPVVGTITAQAKIGELTYRNTRREISYEHIPFQLWQPPARFKAVCLELAIRGQRVGYLPGAGDRTAESLVAMGYAVTSLNTEDLTAERLRGFDAVVVGVRAWNVRTDLALALPALFAYAEAGGNVVVQYNTPNELKTSRLAPFSLELSRDLPRNRVTNEKAPVTLLAPDHLVFNSPNKITPADFDGWVQERGLNFPSQWDHEHFAALLACSDPGEAPLTSGLLVANCGQGRFVYTGLSFFRQLPAGVPGAYRLFANLVSLGKLPSTGSESLRTVTVRGWARGPVTLPFVEGMTLLSAYNSTDADEGPGADAKTLRLTRGNNVTIVNIKEIRQGKAPDVPLQPGDVLQRPEGFW